MLKNYFAAKPSLPAKDNAPLYNQFASTRIEFNDLLPSIPYPKEQENIEISLNESSGIDEQAELEREKLLIDLKNTQNILDENTTTIRAMELEITDLQQHAQNLSKENDVLRHEKYHVDLLRLQRDNVEKDFLELMADHKSGKMQKMIIENKKLRLLIQRLLSSRNSKEE